jgi:hypothetical protein
MMFAVFATLLFEISFSGHINRIPSLGQNGGEKLTQKPLDEHPPPAEPCVAGQRKKVNMSERPARVITPGRIARCREPLFQGVGFCLSASSFQLTFQICTKTRLFSACQDFCD